MIRFSFDPLGILGTLVVNLLGSFGIGLFYGILQKKHMPSWVQNGIAAGLIGSLTTFSAFVTDMDTLISVALWMAVGYAVLSLAGGVACCVPWGAADTNNATGTV